MNRRRLTLPKGAMAVAATLERQAADLRKMASAWCATGIPPIIDILGTECSNFVLSYIDLIDDALQLEADASKLRNLFS